MVSKVKWIKIVVDIFDDEKILLIESLPSADTVIVIWFKILCLAGKMNNGGMLTLNDRIAYTDEMLATIFRRKVADVKMALEIFKQYGMIEIVEDTYCIPNWTKHQSLDAADKKRERDREYQRKHRQALKEGVKEPDVEGEEKKSSDNRLTSDDPSYSLSISNSLFNSISNTIDNNIPSTKSKGNKSNKSIFIVPTLKDIEEYCSREGYEYVNPEKFYYYYESIGWMVGKHKMKSWHRAVAMWNARSREDGGKKYVISTHTEPQINEDRPQRFRDCPDSLWEKFKPYISDDGSFNWSDFDTSVLTESDKAWMAANDM